MKPRAGIWAHEVGVKKTLKRLLWLLESAACLRIGHVRNKCISVRNDKEGSTNCLRAATVEV